VIFDPVVPCIIGPDGHVGGFGTSDDAAFTLRLDLLILQEIGLTGYSFGSLPLTAATQAYTDGLTCEACKARVACGCLLAAVRAGECAHDSLLMISAAVKRVRARLN
jgi:hypothetical protein